MYNKKMRYVLSFFLAVFMMLSGVVSVSADTSIWDHLKGSPKKDKNVSVEVKTYHQDKDGNLTELPGLLRIWEGDDTSYIPVIKNTGKKSDLRIRLYAKSGDKKVNILKWCYGYEDTWTYKKDGWFYLKKPFDAGQEYLICKGFHFPADWDYAENNILDVTVEAEAVQQEPDKDGVDTGDNGSPLSLIFFSGLLVTAFVLVGISRRKEESDE